MKIVKERSRLIITEYTPNERQKIRSLVSTMDKVFIYEDEDKQRILVPTGIEKEISKGLKTQIIDHSNESWPAAKLTKYEHKWSPRDQMQKDTMAFIKKNSGNHSMAVVLPPGAGKTGVGCATAMEIGLRTLIIVPTTNIRGQWPGTLQKMFNVPADQITEVKSADDFMNIKTDWTVVLHTTLSNIDSKYDLEKIMKHNRFGTKIIDETHMFFQNIIRVDGNANIYNNIYLTGTFGRSSAEEDELYHRMFSNLKIFRVPDKAPSLFNPRPGNVYGQKPHTFVNMYWADSQLPKTDVKMLARSTRYGVSIPKYTSMVIKPDEITPYMRQILTVVKQASKIPYGKMLILSPTIESVDILAKHVKRMFPKKKVGTIHSYNTKESNADTMANADIILSTVKSSGTGFDVPGLSTLVIAEEFTSLILTEQVLGRLRRRPDGKETYAFDIVDARIPQFRKWANNRAQFYKRKSKKFKVIDIK